MQLERPDRVAPKGEARLPYGYVADHARAQHGFAGTVLSQIVEPGTAGHRRGAARVREHGQLHHAGEFAVPVGELERERVDDRFRALQKIGAEIDVVPMFELAHGREQSVERVCLRWRLVLFEQAKPHPAVDPRFATDGCDGLRVDRADTDEDRVVLVLERAFDPGEHCAGQWRGPGDEDQDRGAVFLLTAQHLYRGFRAAPAPALNIRNEFDGEIFQSQHEDRDRDQRHHAAENAPAIPEQENCVRHRSCTFCQSSAIGGARRFLSARLRHKCVNMR